MPYSSELIFDVANLYYMNKLTQERIAIKLNISKYKINRILRRALTQGIV